MEKYEGVDMSEAAQALIKIAEFLVKETDKNVALAQALDMLEGDETFGSLDSFRAYLSGRDELLTRLAVYMTTLLNEEPNPTLANQVRASDFRHGLLLAASAFRMTQPKVDTPAE